MGTSSPKSSPGSSSTRRSSSSFRRGSSAGTLGLSTGLALVLVCWAASALDAGERRDLAPPPAECWGAPREVFEDDPAGAVDRFELKIDHLRESLTEPRVESPNRAYAYRLTQEPSARGASGSTHARFLVFVERPYLLRLDTGDVFGVLDDHGVSGKLLYFRVALGRLAFVDIVFDVERERVVHREAGSFGDILFQQAKESCASPAMHDSCARRCYRLPEPKRK